MPYDPTIYLGSAAHYRYGRPASSPELEAVLTREAGLDGNGRLLDVGCGPSPTRFGVPQQFSSRASRICCAIAKASCPATCPCHPSAPHLFGDRLDDFAGEVLGLLASNSAEGMFWDWPGDTEVVMTRKPG